MGKGKSSQKKHIRNSKRTAQHDPARSTDDMDMDDEIDAFHKQRDIVPLDLNDDAEESDMDDEHPIFDLDNEDDEEDENEDDDYDDNDDDVAKIIRQRRYLRAKFGGDEDDLHDNDDEDEENDQLNWGRKKYGSETRNFELQSSDDDAPKEEEEVALQMQREKAKSLTMEDYGLADISEDETDGGITLKGASVKGMDALTSPDGNLALEDTGTIKVEDLNALSKEDQMKVLRRSAPELVHWLSELNEAHEQLQSRINPFLSKMPFPERLHALPKDRFWVIGQVKNGEVVMGGGVHYFELKQQLLLSYCQAITFYLLLKSEGLPVRDHPVIARLEEIKKLLDQTKQLDGKLPVELEDLLKRNHVLETAVKSGNENAVTAYTFTKDQEDHVSAEAQEVAKPQKAVKSQMVESLKGNDDNARKHKDQKDHIGIQSSVMLKVRASLEEKLKQKGLYSSIASKPNSAKKRLRPVNGQLETYDDFDDDAVDGEAVRSDIDIGASKISQFLAPKQKKSKVVSGDDDLPKRDDIGERRRKHELRVLASAGIKSQDDVVDEIVDPESGSGSDGVADEEDDSDNSDSENDLYEQVKQKRAAKLAAKSQTYLRNSAVPLMPETVEGKRQISNEIYKNRGLTRARKKKIKNPRKHNREKHKKAVNRRKGQVRDIKKPFGPYAGETSGINASISRSTRFKS